MKVSKSHPVVKKLLKAAFPEWKGRKVSVELKERVCYDPCWGGGSRDEAVAVSLESGEVVKLPVPAFYSQGYAKVAGEGVALPVGVALLVHSVFCGKDAGVCIYVSPASAAELPRRGGGPAPGGGSGSGGVKMAKGASMVDITNLSDAALDVVLAVKSGEDFVDCDHLSAAERLSVLEALGCELNARNRLFVDASYSEPRKAAGGFDAEAAILDRQEADELG